MLRMKLVVCNMDSKTGNPQKSPKNVSDKGPASCQLIMQNSGQLEMEFIENENQNPIDSYDFWYFGIRICDSHCAGEISRPDLVMAGMIRSFSDRIIIAKPGDMDGLRPGDTVPEEFAAVEKPAVLRKN